MIIHRICVSTVLAGVGYTAVVVLSRVGTGLDRMPLEVLDHLTDSTPEFDGSPGGNNFLALLPDLRR